jgi:hypothetical protein
MRAATIALVIAAMIAVGFVVFVIVEAAEGVMEGA